MEAWERIKKAQRKMPDMQLAREANFDQIWKWHQELNINTRDRVNNYVIEGNEICWNCFVRLLPVHKGLMYCGDCRMIPQEERRGSPE